METYIDRLFQHGGGRRVGFVLAGDESTCKWASFQVVELWQAAALHSGLDPDLMGAGWCDLSDFLTLYLLQDQELAARSQSSPIERWAANLDRACWAVEDGFLKIAGEPNSSAAPEETLVSLAEFAAWSRRHELLVVCGFESTIHLPVTPKLKALLAAREHWRTVANGGNYDPCDLSTAPRAADVVKSLVAAGLAQSVAEAGASIIKPSGIRSGPRNRRTKVEVPRRFEH